MFTTSDLIHRIYMMVILSNVYSGHLGFQNIISILTGSVCWNHGNGNLVSLQNMFSVVIARCAAAAADFVVK